MKLTQKPSSLKLTLILLSALPVLMMISDLVERWQRPKKRAPTLDAESQARLDRYDHNHDGQLDATEYAEEQHALGKTTSETPTKSAPNQTKDTNPSPPARRRVVLSTIDSAPPTLTKEEQAKEDQRLLLKYDSNKNGVLDPKETPRRRMVFPSATPSPP
jgi:hypothetical protein